MGKKLTLQHVVDHVNKVHFGAEVLSKVYVRNNIKMDFKCEKGHNFDARPDTVFRGHWCPDCAGLKKHTLTHIREHIEKRYPGSILLSTNYLNSKKKLDFICENKHNFSLRTNSLLSGQWCSFCADEKRGNSTRQSFEFIRNKILKLHPKCTILENGVNYKKVTSKVAALCEDGHRFFITPADLFHKGVWCPDCRSKKIQESKRYSSEEIKKILLSIDSTAKLRALEYVKGRSASVTILCSKKHLFSSTISRVIRGQWCPECKTERTKKTNLAKYGVEYISQVKEIALRAARSLNNSMVREHWKDKAELICVGSYELKVVDYLNKHKINFMWQPRIFVLPNNKTYRPDLYLENENKWVEIKGYFRKDAIEKWQEFQIIQPNSELWDQKKLKEMGIL